MPTLLLEALLAPSLIAAGSLAQRRWGSRAGGLLIGLPLTSLPLLALVAAVHGTAFAAGAASASLAGTVPQAVLIGVWALAARRLGPLASLAAGTAAFAALAAVLDVAPALPALVAAAGGVAAFGGVLRWWPRVPGREAGPVATRSDLPVRMALAAGFTVAVSQASGAMGPRMSGLMSALPVLTMVMGALTHRGGGRAAAIEFLRGVTRGSFSVVTALAVLALLLPGGHLVVAFAAAAGVAAATQLATGLVPEGAQAQATQPSSADSDRSGWAGTTLTV